VYTSLAPPATPAPIFDVASTWKRDVPFIGPVGEVASIISTADDRFADGRVRVRANTDYFVLPYGQFTLGLYHCGVCDVNDFALQGGPVWIFGRRAHTSEFASSSTSDMSRRGERVQCGAALGRRGIAAQ